jgi:hypothetical protein
MKNGLTKTMGKLLNVLKKQVTMTKSGTTWINSLFCEGRLQVNQQARPQRRAKGRRVTRALVWRRI